MSKKILKDLPELVSANVISEETAAKVRTYYESRQTSSSGRLILAFSIFGAILMGLGVILIIAHNWDELSRGVKTFFAFLPLVTGQVLCGYVLVKKKDAAWREASAVFLFFAVGAAISLVSQIYNIPGNFAAFMATWMILTIPVVYLLRSGVASLLYVIGITAFACIKGYFDSPSIQPYVYWILLALVLPFYYRLNQRKANGNFSVFHHWFIPLSVTISLGTIARNSEEYMFIAYMSMFGIFYLAGKARIFRNAGLLGNPYLVLGALGMLTVLLMLSFEWFWRDLAGYGSDIKAGLFSVEMGVSLVLTIAAAFLFNRIRKDSPNRRLDLLEAAFAIFFITFFIGGLFPNLAVLIINLLVLCAGLLFTLSGAKQDRLDILNFGMAIIAALIACRFFDAGLTFVLRGILFVLVGTGFFLANYLTLKKRKIRGS